MVYLELLPANVRWNSRWHALSWSSAAFGARRGVSPGGGKGNAIYSDHLARGGGWSGQRAVRPGIGWPGIRVELHSRVQSPTRGAGGLAGAEGRDHVGNGAPAVR